MSAIFQALKFLPASLGMKVITKQYPKLKNFFTDAAAYGYDTSRALEYLSERFSPTPPSGTEGAARLSPGQEVAQQETAKGNAPMNAIKNLAAFGAGGMLSDPGQMQETAETVQETPQGIEMIEQQMQEPENGAADLSGTSSANAPTFEVFLSQFPELGKFIDEQMRSGKDIREAGLAAKNRKFFRGITGKMEKQFGKPFEDLIAELWEGRAPPVQKAAAGAQQNLQRSISQLSALINQRGGNVP